MTNDTAHREGRTGRPWYRWLTRTRTPWMLGALTIAVALVVRSVVEQGPQASKADAAIDATAAPPRSRTGTPVARAAAPPRKRGIERDIFVRERPIGTGDPAESRESVPLPSAPAGPSTDEAITAALSGLVLRAIVMGEQPKAFLNGRFVRVGEELHLEGYRDMVCEVKAIYEESVVLVSGRTSVVLRLVPKPTR